MPKNFLSWIASRVPINFQIVNVLGKSNVVNQAVGQETLEDPITVEQLAEVARSQLELELNSGKYIRDVFIEVHETKNVARGFAHPYLFIDRILDEMGRLDFDTRNEVLGRVGMPPLPFPNLDKFRREYEPSKLSAIATTLIDELQNSLSEAKVYEELDLNGPPPHPIASGKEHLFEERKYNLNSIFYGLSWDVEKKIRELQALKASVFVLTGKAGQGKTNFVCDFVEKFLFRHDIPCVYFSGRNVGVRNFSDLGDSVKQSITNSRSSFDDLMKSISKLVCSKEKYFILVIDAINEHDQINLFRDQLEDLIYRALAHPNIKVMLTCRSEYFDQRFGNLMQARFKDVLYIHDSDRTRLEERQRELLLDGYFNHFQLNKRLISDHVVEILREDVLLLRFFCEAYGAKNRPKNYVQREIKNIAREEIFSIYLRQKLQSAAAELGRGGTDIAIKDAKREVERLLKHILEYMIDNEIFGDVPISSVPTDLLPALSALLGEDLILRRDAPEEKGTFSSNYETINFTFDEFRDFLLASFLYENIFRRDQQRFVAFVREKTPDNIQSIEGLKRYLFYLSRSREDEKFYQLYSNEGWYNDVYVREIFNIDADLHRQEDAVLIREILDRNDYLSTRVSAALVVRWNAEANPILNLNLYLEFVRGLDSAAYNEAVLKPFAHRSWYDRDGIDARYVCSVLQERILPRFVASVDRRYSPLFLLVAWLLPVDADPNLDSESMRVFSRLGELHPEYAVEVLAESLQANFDTTRPYVWRLCAQVAEHVPPDHLLRTIAKADEVKEGALAREAMRFVNSCF